MRRTRLSVSSVTIAAVLLVGGRAVAQPNPSTEDERACWNLVSAQAEAWNHGDAKALAADFAPDGEFIASDGSVVVGRDEFAKRQAGRVRTIPKDRRLWIKLRSMRELGTSGMLVDTDQEISTDPESAAPGNEAERRVERQLRVRYIFAKEEGRWWIAGQQETEVKEPARSEIETSGT